MSVQTKIAARLKRERQARRKADKRAAARSWVNRKIDEALASHSGAMLELADHKALDESAKGC